MASRVVIKYQRIKLYITSVTDRWVIIQIVCHGILGKIIYSGSQILNNGNNYYFSFVSLFLFNINIINNLTVNIFILIFFCKKKQNTYKKTTKLNCLFASSKCNNANNIRRGHSLFTKKILPQLNFTQIKSNCGTKK